ncbi:MAG: RES family NAD+ phosphorylase [Actinomycetota bacterium]
MLYRVFPWNPARAPQAEGGALFVPRIRQATGRHDNPDRYGALYVSRDPESAVAERIQAFRGRVLTDARLIRRDGSRYALVSLADDDLSPLVDLDDPAQLVARGLRPSLVATGDRSRTRSMAAALFDEGGPGFLWWSTLEASWANATLFAERSVSYLQPLGEPEPLSLDHPALRAAADRLGVLLP